MSASTTKPETLYDIAIKHKLPCYVRKVTNGNISGDYKHLPVATWPAIVILGYSERRKLFKAYISFWGLVWLKDSCSYSHQFSFHRAMVRSYYHLGAVVEAVNRGAEDSHVYFSKKKFVHEHKRHEYISVAAYYLWEKLSFNHPELTSQEFWALGELQIDAEFIFITPTIPVYG